MDPSVEKLCESMQRMLVQFMEQAQAKTSSGSSGVSEVVRVPLESNLVKLTGPGVGHEMPS